MRSIDANSSTTKAACAVTAELVLGDGVGGDGVGGDGVEGVEPTLTLACMYVCTEQK